MLTGAEGMVILTGVTVARGRTLLFAAFGLCLGAIDVSVGPTESVILEGRSQSCHLIFPLTQIYVQEGLHYVPF